MASLYETKFDVLCRKLQEEKLALKKRFDDAYARDDFRASMGVMETIQGVMSKLSALEAVEKPFREVSRVLEKIDDLRLNIEAHLEDLGKEYRHLDSLREVLDLDLKDEFGVLQALFKEEEGRRMQLDFERFDEDELMSLMRFSPENFPSRQSQFEEYSMRNFSEYKASCEPQFDFSEWERGLGVQRGQALDGLVVLELEDEVEEEPVAEKEIQEEFPIDHGVEDLSEFSRQNLIPVLSDEQAAQILQMEPEEPEEIQAEDIPFEDEVVPEEEGITADEVAAYEQSVQTAQNEEAPAMGQPPSNEELLGAEEEYSDAECPPEDDYDLSEEVYTEEQEAYVEERVYAEDAYTEPGAYVEDVYAEEQVYTEEAVYTDEVACDEGYEESAEYTEAVVYPENAAVYAGEETAYAEEAVYAEEVAYPEEAYAEGGAYAEEQVYTEEAAYTEDVAYEEQAFYQEETYPDSGEEYSEEALYAEAAYLEDSSDYAKEVAVEIEDQIEPESLEAGISYDVLEISLEEPVVIEEEAAAVDDVAIDLDDLGSGPTEDLAPSELNMEELDIGLDESDPKKKEGSADDLAIDLDEIQIDLDDLNP